MKNKLVLAGAGTGKTTYIVEQALKEKSRVLITTFTIRCREEIKEKIINIVGYCPKNIIVQTWFSFLYEHGILPYKKELSINEVNGINFVEGKSGLKTISKSGFPIYYGEKEFDLYFFDKNKRIYTDKLSKLVLKINDASGGLVFERIHEVFDRIFIDEVQDMVGYDLEIIKKLATIKNNLLIVGDPRQTIYSTHCDSKYKKYDNGKIDKFIKEECKLLDFEIDNLTLNKCHRCHKEIVNFMNGFYPEYNKLFSKEIPINEGQGIFVIRKKDVEKYLNKYNPWQLRYSKATKVNENFNSINYKNSKGCTFQRTLIYPTNELKEYLKNNKKITKISTKNAIYVALSRGIDSVAIVYDGPISLEHKIPIYSNFE